MVRLGLAGTIAGVDIDNTSFFTGNFPTFGINRRMLFTTGEAKQHSTEWQEILPSISTQ
ncbi:hypothetical protein OK016_29480 [Vibrio chagasii]|nr:hypothetical protein [Vibrio chagasii]